MWFGNYGITDKINVMAMVPYIKTEASQGTLHGMEGIQDLSVGVKYNFFDKKFEKSVFKTFAAFNFSTPLTDYTPDFFPLSIGTQTTNLMYRLNAFYKMEQGWFANASAGYTWRSNTTLDRPSYYDGTDFYNSDEVEMPNVFDFFVSMGYLHGGIAGRTKLFSTKYIGWWRYPSSGYAIRFQPHELSEGWSIGDVLSA